MDAIIQRVPYINNRIDLTLDNQHQQSQTNCSPRSFEIDRKPVTPLHTHTPRTHFKESHILKNKK